MLSNTSGILASNKSEFEKKKYLYIVFNSIPKYFFNDFPFLASEF
mgnify:FL=1